MTENPNPDLSQLSKDESIDVDQILDDAGVDDLLNLVAASINAENDLGFLRSQSKIGKFEVDQLLGSGGQAICFLATDPDLDRKVVLKLYKKKH